MAIPRSFKTSNPVVRDALSDIPREVGVRAGEVAIPDFEIPAEIVTTFTSAEHSLNLDDLRAPGSLTKEVLFEAGTTSDISVVEHAQKSRMDIRDIEAAGIYGVQMMAERAAMHRTDIEDAKEYRIATLATTAANFGVNNKSAGEDLAAAGIRKKFAAWVAPIKAAGFPVTDMILGTDALTAFQINPDIHDWFGSKGEGFIDESVLKAFFRIPGRVVIASYSRILGNDAAPTEFWPSDFVLLVSNRRTLSPRTFGVTPVVPYGAAFGRNGGVITDVRTADISGTEGLREIAAHQRYKPIGANFDLGFLADAVVGF